ncbi:MAG: ChrR Cupin-like domain [Phormidesmis priestleyi Ana]|uniref:ChrR Cupin-like domain n=1 Tax=Phormidesmis priestleyi Ana TaxID=1666911 RepID=A0A0P8BXI4_9CYAN|nr:MAG: ChrR Cupin-like domain [Phormidesmis priestleyi Ana]
MSSRNTAEIPTAEIPEPGDAIALNELNSGAINSTIIDLADLTTSPERYDFFTFRPNLKKLILAGSEDAEHISILWYTVADGSVGLHSHHMTEAVFTIEGTQTDAKGTYPTGSLYFNPPGSGHAISDSSGFFILAYASPPDFANTDSLKAYTPVHIDTADSDLEHTYPFVEAQKAVNIYDLPLDPAGGICSTLIKSTSPESYEYTGNYLLVLRGRCNIDGAIYNENTLVVATTVEPKSYKLSAIEGQPCLSLGLSLAISQGL